MDEPRHRSDHRAERVAAVLSALRWLLLGTSMALVIVAVLLPSSALSWMRRDWTLFGELMNRLDGASGRFDMTHVALFAWAGFLFSSLWPRVGGWRWLGVLLALAVGSELVQFLVPGREPKIGDLHDDLVGIALGTVLALPLRFFLRRVLAGRLGAGARGRGSEGAGADSDRS